MPREHNVGVGHEDGDSIVCDAGVLHEDGSVVRE